LDNTCFYKILDIGSKTDAPGIKKAYQKLAKKFHPDIAQQYLMDDEDLKRVDKAFTKINTAYMVLSKPIKRQKYDDAREYANRKYKNSQDSSKKHDEYVHQNYEYTKKREHDQKYQPYNYWHGASYEEGYSEFNNHKGGRRRKPTE
jgi:DnaJ-class molecular chaperone